MSQRLWTCPHCNSWNMFFENIESCMACGEEVEICDMIFSDEEEDGSEYNDRY